MKTTLWSTSIGDIPTEQAFKNNLSATTDPTTGDDANDNYEVGSVWVNKTAGRPYICTDPTVGAAVWTLMGESGIDPTELALLNGAVAGTVVASKAVAVDASKDVADFRNLSGTNLKAGKDAVAGTVVIFPATTAKGSTVISADDNAGATTTTVKTAAQAGARTYTVPDAGASASFAMSEGAQTINGVKTFGSPPVMSGASIGAATVPNTALVANGGLAALIGAGLGASANYAKTTVGAQTLLANAAGDRAVLIVVVVNETFADVGGTQTTFQIGQTGTANKFFDTAAFHNKAAGTVLTSAGILTGTDDLIVTGVAATVDGTGGLSVTVLALPTT